MAIWKISVQNVGTGTLTVSRNSLNIDGATVNLTLAQGSGVVIFTDGTNYFTERGSGGGGGSVTFGGDLATVDSTHQKVVGIDGIPIDTTVTWVDGMTFQYNASSGKLVPVFDRATRPVSSVPGKPSAGQLVLIYTAEATETFPANFTAPQSYGSLGVNPTATAVYQIFKNTTNVGTVSISTSGVFTFATTSGAAFTLNAGDRFTMVAPGSQDATLSDVSITLVGTRGSVSATISTPPPVHTWRGAYSGGTAYNPYDEVSYLGSSYICIAASTGNLPTNTSFWNLLASMGTNGTNGTNGQILIVDAQNETYSYVLGAGSANAYTASPGTAYGTAADGQQIAVKIPATNTLASTLNVSALGAATIKKLGSTGLVDVAAGDLQSGGIYEFTRNGSIWQLTGGSGGGGGAAGALVLLESHTASSSTELDFTASISSSYDEYQIEIIGFNVAANGAAPLLQFSTNGGSSWDTTSIYEWSNNISFMGGATTGGNAQTNVNGISLFSDSGRVGLLSTATPGLVCSFRISDPLSTINFKNVFFGGGVAVYSGSGGQRYSYNFGGVYKNTAAVNAFRIIMTSGNIAAGTVRCYGVAH
jgi:hypothetical protein